MARIRKKTSKRGTTNQGARIVKKAKETRKKNKRAAKRDVTWKSKKEKDPGIPNSYPYKDQVLAELAANKRATEEEKAARIEAAKAARKAAQEEEDEEVPGILNLYRSSVIERNPVLAEAGPSSPSVSPPPELVDTALPTLQAAIDRADVLLEVLDARDPMGGRSAWLEGLVSSADGQVVIALTKIDLVPQEAVTAWLNFLRPHFPTVLFKSAVPVAPLPRVARGQVAPAEDPARIRARSVLGKAGLAALLQEYSAAKKGKGKDEDLIVAVMGLPNVGKSSLINSFLPTARLAVAPQIPATSSKRNAPTTAVPVEVVVDVTPELQVCLIDTPGWEFDMEEDPEDGSEDDVAMEDMSDAEGDDEAQQDKWDRLEEIVTRDMLLRNLGRVDKVKDVAPLVNHIVSRASTQDLMLCYNIPAFQAGDIEAFLTAVARASGRIKKHGVADVEAAARVVLRDWSHNTFPYYTLPATSAAVELNAFDKAALDGVLSRKELRRANAKGVVKMTASPLDTREIVLDDDYTEALLPSDSEDDEDELMDEDDLEDDDDDEDEEDVEPEAEMWDGAGDEAILTNDDEPSDAEMSDSASPPPPTRRQARAAKASKSKKVAFPSALEAPRSEPAVEVAEPVGILKKTNKVEKKVKPAAVKKVAPVPAPAKAKAAPVKAKAVERAAEGEKPYDFGAHFF